MHVRTTDLECALRREPQHCKRLRTLVMVPLQTMDTTRPSLLLRIRNRTDVDAWSLFDDIYRPILHRYGRAWGLDFNDAEDVVQHTLSALHQKLDGFSYDPARGRFRSWLRTVVNIRIRNLRRNRERDGQVENLDFEAADLANEDPSDEEVFDQLWLQEHLWSCLHELQAEVDDTTFQIFTRHVFDEVPASELASEFGVSTGNVHTIKWRLTRKIAERMRFLTNEEST